MVSISRRFVISREFLEWIIISLLLVISFVHSIGLLLFLILILSLLLQREVGAIKILNLIILRTIINPGVAVGISQFQILKWIILFSCAIYLILSYFKMNKVQKNKLNNIIILVAIFAIYNIIVSFIFSSLPIVATFKVFSYSIIFLGILIGVIYTEQKITWINWMITLLSLIIIPSIVFIVIPVGYFINGHAFQGITDQPNMFGIVAALFLALLFTNKQIGKNTISNKFYFFALFFVSFYMIILSESRTGFISSFVLIFMYLLFSKIKWIFKYLFVYITTIILILVPIFRNHLFSFFSDFLYKGGQDILFSRAGQVEGLLYNFLSNPWFGRGFQVPVLPYKSFEFGFNYFVEPGNLVLAVLSNSGIIGFILFIFYMGYILLKGIKQFGNVGFLFISVIFICMGEMVFFSSNSIGIWCYMFFALYIAEFKKTMGGRV